MLAIYRFSLISKVKRYLSFIGADGGFGGLEVRVLAFGTQVRGFKPGRSSRIFRAKKSSARLPSEGK